MPKIALDVLIPAAELEVLLARAEKLARVMAAHNDGQVHDIAVATTPEADRAYIEPQLRDVFATEHEERTIEEVHGEVAMHRLLISLTPGNRSLNDLAMLFSRLLTPPVELPTQSVLLENQEAFESPATFPWTINVYPNA